MARKPSRGATRNPVRKQRATIAWKPLFAQFFMICALSTVVAGLVYLQQDDTLPILHVSVEGNFSHADKKALVKTVMPFVTGNFINVDVDKLREAGQSLPWVKVVQVKRQWPDGLHLVVEEHTALARWGKNALLNTEGELFMPKRASFPTGLPLIQGPEGSSPLMVQRYKTLDKTFTKLGMQLATITMDRRRAWTLQFNNGMEIRLGRAQNEQRLNRFLQVYKAGLNTYQTDIAVVDMRYTNGLSVVWKLGQKPDFNGTV